MKRTIFYLFMIAVLAGIIFSCSSPAVLLQNNPENPVNMNEPLKQKSLSVYDPVEYNSNTRAIHFNQYSLSYDVYYYNLYNNVGKVTGNDGKAAGDFAGNRGIAKITFTDTSPRENRPPYNIKSKFWGTSSSITLVKLELEGALPGYHIEYAVQDINGIWSGTYRDGEIACRAGSSYSLYFDLRAIKVNIIEPVRYTSTFDLKYYIDHNPDVQITYGYDYQAVYDHWIKYGIKEGRKSASYFDLKYYLARYPDLQQAYGTDYQKLYDHWVKYGLKEGRRASADFDIKTYVNRYADIKAAYGTDYITALNHYLIYGMREGRSGKP